MARDADLGDQLIVARGFVVEAEALAFMTDRMNARGNINETARALRRARRLPFGVIDRVGRVLREGMQDVGEQQFLVLLLVMQADLQNREYALRVRRRHLLDQPLDRRIDMGAIAGDVLAVRPGDQAALGAGVARPSGDIIGVEQERKTLIENPVGGIVRHQQELLEEPGDVRAVPFGRRGVGHRLDDLVLGRQRRGALFRLRAHATKGVAPDSARRIERLPGRPTGGMPATPRGACEIAVRAMDSLRNEFKGLQQSI